MMMLNYDGIKEKPETLRAMTSLNRLVCGRPEMADSVRSACGDFWVESWLFRFTPASALLAGAPRDGSLTPNDPLHRPRVAGSGASYS
jgi:hypothetical protein